MEKRKFDTATLITEDLEILADFKRRRQTFDDAIHAHQLELFTCPGCGFPMLNERGGYDICLICDWEDDGQDDAMADEYWGGPNGGLCLTENRLNIGRALNELIARNGGQINTNLSAVLTVINNLREHLNEIGDSIPEDATLNHPGWVDYSNARKNVLSQLIARQ